MGTPSNCWKIGPPSMGKNDSNFDTIFLMYRTTMKILKHNHPISWIAFYLKIIIYIRIQGIIVCHVFNFFEEHHKSFTPSIFYWFNTYQYFTLPFSFSPFELSISFNGPSLTNFNTLSNFSPQIEHVHHPPPEIVHNFVSTLRRQYLTH